MKKLFIITMTVLVLAFLAASSLVFFTDTFDVQDIKISGNTRYSDEEILKLTGSDNEIKAPYIYIRYLSEIAKDRKKSYLEEMLLSHPYIEDLFISYKPPGNFEINVFERQPKAVVKLDTTYILTDENTYALEILEELPDIPGYIIIEGFVENSYRLGRKIELKGDVNIEDIYRIIKILAGLDEEYGYTFRKDIYKADVLPGGIVNLIYNEDFKVKLDINDDILYKAKFAGQIIYESNVENFKGILDTTFTNPTIIGK